METESEAALSYQRVPRDTTEMESSASGQSYQNKTDASIMSTVFNLSNNIVGAGLLSLPWCFKQSSIFGGIVLFLLVGVLSGLSLVLIANCCELTGRFTFKELGERTLGRKFSIVFQLSMLIYTFFSCVSFLILVGDFFSGSNGIAEGICDHDCDHNGFVKVFGNRFSAVLILTLVILFPLSCLKNLYALRYTSLLSIFGMSYIFALLFYEYARKGKSEYDLNTFNLSWNIFSAAPIVNVAFIAHYNAPKYYQEMKNRSIQKFATAVAIALSFCGMIYVGVALFGYLTFGSSTESDILENFGDDDTAALIGRVAMSQVVLFTYPLAFNALRQSALSLIVTFSPETNIHTPRLFYSVTTTLVALTFIPGSTIEDIGVVLDYKGATLGGLIGFGYGAMMYLSIVSNSNACPSSEDQALIPPSSDESIIHRPQISAFMWKHISYLFIAWALITGVLGCVVTTLKLLQ